MLAVCILTTCDAIVVSARNVFLRCAVVGFFCFSSASWSQIPSCLFLFTVLPSSLCVRALCAVLFSLCMYSFFIFQFRSIQRNLTTLKSPEKAQAASYMQLLKWNGSFECNFLQFFLSTGTTSV